MPISLPFSLMPPVLDRALLWLNHVLAAEPAATARLAAHAGRKVTVQWQGPAGPWPLPLPPDVVLRITPAGLCESVEGEPDTALPSATGLRVTVVLPAPHQLPGLWLTGKRPPVNVEGDAQFAADVAWLAENLRWDVEHDLSRFVGDAAAHELMRFGAALRDGLRGAARGAGDLWSQRPGARAATSR
ncbi:hypothetical protein [Methylibium sp.]|uniref:hypothetical protein n=1 Tax=Methylibium sp. TaxID=2067992 RepID=UPI001854C9B6|nr:hypothetical protein [Methylibium sp.]MBA3588020.1 hypothetical protein [Methylibium sp.]